MPVLPRDVVERTRLFVWLSEAAESPVTTVTAPAGWGKTQLLASWVRSPYCHTNVGWLTVDRRDTDPARFWPGVMAMVSHVLPDTVDDTGDEDPAVPFLRSLSTLTEPLLMIFDDVHWLEGSTVESDLAWLLTRLPAGVRVVLSGVYLPALPVSRLRVEGKLHALTAKDLSFDLHEATQIFAASGLTISSRDAQRLQARTEGWSAGLRLAALALNDTDSVEDFIDHFTGDDADVADYLATEVLANLPHDLQEFLLRTSVCDTLTADLANALTEQDDGEEKIRWLTQHNVFLIADASHKGWYRFHGMFAELLRSRLRRRSDLSARDLHRVVSQWCTAHDLLVMAYHHACLGEDWTAARQILTTVWLSLYLDGQLETIQRLVRQLPAHVQQNDPDIGRIEIAAALALGAGTADISDAALAGAGLDERIGVRRTVTNPIAASEDSSEQHPLADPAPIDPTATVPSLVVDLERGRLSGNLREVADAAYALAQMSDAVNSFGTDTVNGLRALALQQLGVTEYWVGRRADAEAHLREALSVAQDTGKAYVELSCLSQLVGVLTAQHRLNEALSVADDASTLARQHGWELLGPMAEVWHARGWTAYMRGDLDSAEQHLAAAAAAVRRQDSGVGATVLLVRGLITSMRGQKREALADLDAAALVAYRMPTRYLFDDYLIAERARLRLALGDAAKARDILAPYPVDAAGPILLTVAHAEILIGDGRSEQAANLLGEAVAQGSGLHDEMMQAMILLALLLDQRTPSCDRSAEVLDKALDLAAPQRYVQPFLQFGGPVGRLLRMARLRNLRHAEFIDQLRSVLERTTPEIPDYFVEAAQDSLAEPLTKRELQVLRALERPAAFPELARELFVSLNTLKAHLRSIYRKLDVNGRHGAVIKARNLGLLQRAQYGPSAGT